MDRRALVFIFSVSLTFFAIQYWFAPPPNNGKEMPKMAVVQNEEIYRAPSNETYYVLENDYQQLVFSNIGGSIVEINLPFRKSDPKSYVNEIDFDRQILAESPQNARFPLKPYKTYSGETLEGQLGGYYPLLRRGINGADIPAEYYALNVVGEEVAQVPFQMTRFEKNLIEFQGSVGSTRITKTFSIPEEHNGPYCFQLDLQVNGNPEGLWIGSGLPDVEIVSNSYDPILRIQTTKNKVSDVDTVNLPKKGVIDTTWQPINWLSNCNGFLGVIMDPLKEMSRGYRTAFVDGKKVPTRLSLIGHAYPAESYPAYATYLPLMQGTMRVFAGPYDHRLLKELDALYDEPLKNYNPDYISALSIQGWFSFISQPFSKFLSLLMDLFYAITHSWAASIILLTIALKAMMYPLNNWSIRSTLKMQEISPKVKALQEKYKKDPKKAQMEIMNLYRSSGVNPLMGCLPTLLQLPFLIGMFYLLKSSFPLRGAMFIPGWIDNLSAPDVLFSWNTHIWFIGNEFHLLPILMGVTMYLQQKFTSQLPKDASQLTEAQKQQKMMGTMMSVLFTVMFYNFPSGLNIYFMLSTLLGILQQYWMMKKMKSAAA